MESLYSLPGSGFNILGYGGNSVCVRPLHPQYDQFALKLEFYGDRNLPVLHSAMATLLKLKGKSLENVVSVHDVSEVEKETGEWCYMHEPCGSPPRKSRAKEKVVVTVQSLLSGITLRDFLLQGNELTSESKEIIRQALFKGIEALHRHEIAHLDIYTGNIMLIRDETKSIKGAILFDLGRAGNWQAWCHLGSSMKGWSADWHQLKQAALKDNLFPEYLLHQHKESAITKAFDHWRREDDGKDLLELITCICKDHPSEAQALKNDLMQQAFSYDKLFINLCLDNPTWFEQGNKLDIQEKL